MELRHLETFAAVVKAGSFVGAAEKLGYSQSTITVQMQALERELGVELFSRDAKRATLTEGGIQFAHHAERILENIENLRVEMGDFANGDGGLIRIAANDLAARRLTPILSHFMATSPKIKVVIESGGTVSASERVARGAMDLALCTVPSARLGLLFEPLFVEEQHALLPADHELASKPKVRAKDILRHRVLLTECGCQYRETTDSGFMKSGLLLAPAIEIGNIEVLKHAVKAGLGIAILPASLATPPPKGTVVRPLEGVRVSLTIGMARRADPPPSRALQLLMEEIRKGIAARPAA